jgi:hypothetical protein
VACLNAPNNLFYHNNGDTNHWLKMKLTGTASNRSAIGAKAHVLATFGLGDATNTAIVRSEWPSGLVQELRDVAVNQSLTITEHQQGVTHAPSLIASRSGAVGQMPTGVGRAVCMPAIVE